MRRFLFLLSTYLAFGPLFGQQPTIPSLKVDALLARVEEPSDTIFVINFWATWCRPCVEEIPEFNKIEPFYQNKPVKVIMASLDFPSQKESMLAPFLNANPIRHSIVLLISPRGGEWIDRVDPSWSGALPGTLIIHGGKRVFHEGETSALKIREKMTSLL